MQKRSKAARKPSIAITGTSGFLGRSLLELLWKEEKHRVVSLDRQPLPRKFSKIAHYNVDLTAADIHKNLLSILKKERCRTLVHAALFSKPPHNLEESHELQSVGTMHLLHAAAKANLHKLILISTTDVYGAFPENPNFLTEEHLPRAHRLSPFLKDKIDAEIQFQNFAKKYPHRVVTILRPATILGPRINNFKTHFLQNPLVPMVLGYDPLFQFVHETDVFRNLQKVLSEDHAGVFNIVGEGVLPLSRAIAIIGKIPLPLPEFLLLPAAATGWYLNVAPTPPDHINFLKYHCIADGEKAKRKLHLKPVYTSQEALLSFGVRGLRMSLRAQRSNDNRL